MTAQTVDAVRGAGTGRRRAWAAGALVLSSSLAVLAGGSAPSSASVDVAFNGLAGADGMRLQAIIPGAPVSSHVIDGGGPVAQAALTSAGGGQGFAAFPYPGDAPMGAPGLTAGALGGAGVPVPEQVPTSYPFAVNADSNAPEQAVGSGPYTLRAKTTSDGAEARASTGYSQEGAGLGVVTSEASMIRSLDNVTALAVTRATGLQIGPLTLGQVTGTAKVTLLPDGTAQRSSSLDVAGVSVAGTPVAAAPDNPEDLVEALNAALAPTKTRVQYLGTQEIPGGLVSGVLSVTTPFPTGGAEGTLRLLLGRASAAIRTEEGQVTSVEATSPPTGTGDASDASTPAVLPPAPPAESQTAGYATGVLPSFSSAAAFPSAAASSTPLFTNAGSAVSDAPAPNAEPPLPVEADHPGAGAPTVRLGSEHALRLQPSSARGLTFGSAYAAIALLVAAGAFANQLARRMGRKLT